MEKDVVRHIWGYQQWPFWKKIRALSSRAKNSRMQLYTERKAGFSLKVTWTDSPLFMWNPFSGWKWLPMVEGLLLNSKHELEWQDFLYGFHWAFGAHSKPLDWTPIPLLSPHWTPTFLGLQGPLFDLYWPTISNRFPITDTWIFLLWLFSCYLKCCRIIAH